MPPSEGRQIADRLLNKLLDRLERTPERARRVIERLPATSLYADDRDDLYDRLKEARLCGAVELEMGTYENRHNIERVVLSVPESLYALLGRSRPCDQAAEAAAFLVEHLGDLTPQFGPVVDEIVDGWRNGRNVLKGIGPEEVAAVVPILKAAAALLSGGYRDFDMRTFSRRVMGDSKAAERNLGRIADVLRRVATVDDELDAGELIESFGIKRFPQPCLLAGPIAYQGARLPTHPFVGVAPEMVEGLSLAAEPRWILTIENLASFNRQVREALPEDGIVIYTGGFPSDATLGVILTLAMATDAPVFHWGDIDVGGLRIAYRIEQVLQRVDKALSLHQMTPEIAVRQGEKLPRPVMVFKNGAPVGSATAPLVEFLATDQAAVLEQEEQDPTVPV